MSESGIEVNLKNNGFTTKEIEFIKNRAVNDNVSIENVLAQINRVCLSLSLVVIILLLFGVWDFFSSEDFNIYTYTIMFFFVLVLVCIFAPVKLGAKVFIYLMKYRS